MKKKLSTMFEGPDSSLARAYGEAVKEAIEGKAWMFITSDGKVVSDIHYVGEIYFKKPKPIMHPFDYSENRKPTWQPTPITITYQLPIPSKGKGNKAKKK